MCGGPGRRTPFCLARRHGQACGANRGAGKCKVAGARSQHGSSAALVEDVKRVAAWPPGPLNPAAILPGCRTPERER